MVRRRRFPMVSRMIEYENFIYLDVYKTGSTHVVDLLKRVTAGRAITRSRHSPLRRGLLNFGKPGKFTFATVRNPWDWYVSMWAYGHTTENPLYQHILEAFGPERHSALYNTGNPAASFSEWLRSIHDPAFLAVALKKFRLPHTGLTPFMGFYTYRFMKVTLPSPEILLRWPFIRSMDGAIAFQKRWAMYDGVLKTETLDDDLRRLAETHGPALGFRPNAVAIIDRMAANHKNISNRTLASYRDYYSDELRDLVARRDRLVIDLFGYSF
jgi:hypothetical protein